ncbi:MAG: O-antigen ligase family protein [Chlamydiota bacterium]|nr:O-antigen ligase family protein [Chlamydiota bacterium]
MKFYCNVHMLQRLLVWQIVLLFVAILFSKALIEILLISIIVTWMVKRSSEKNFTFPINPLRVPFLLFLLSGAISLVNSPNLGKSLGELINLSEYVLVCLIATEILTDKDDMYKLFGIVIMASLLMGLDGYFQMIYGHDILFGRAVGTVGDTWRMSASFKHPNTLGAYVAGMLPVFIAFLYEQKKRCAPRWCMLSVFIVIVLLIGCLLLSYSRGAWVGVFGGILLLGLLKDRKLIILIFLLFLPLLMSASMMERARGIINLEDVSLQTRLQTWKLAWEMFLAHPLIGQGLKSFSVIHQQGYVHNCLLQILAETGLLGLSAFAFVLIRFFQKVLKSPDFLICGIASGVFAICLHSLVDTHFYSLILATMTWLMIGLGLRSVNPVHKAALEKKPSRS